MAPSSASRVASFSVKNELIGALMKSTTTPVAGWTIGGSAA
jgi:hypothetical protein